MCSKTLIGIFLMTGCSVYAQRTDFWNINFREADSTAFLYAGNDLKYPDKLAHDLTQNLKTDVEKFRAIFRWITDNIAYDYELFLTNQKKEKHFSRNKRKLTVWKKQFSKKVYKKTLLQKKSVCSGYAMLLEYMSNQAGITCETISGYGRNSLTPIGFGAINHAWNSVKLDNKWYLCDATWASGFYDNDMKRFHKMFDRNYFLTEPYLFVSDHFPADTSWVLLYEKPSLREFLDAPLKSSAFISNKINQYSPKNGFQKIKCGQRMSFQFTSNRKDIDTTARFDISEAINGKTITKQTHVQWRRQKDGYYSADISFEEKGVFQVDIYINSDHTFTYRVTVN